MQAFEQQIQQLRAGNYESVREFMIETLGYTPAQAEEVIRNAKRILGRLPEQQRNRKETRDDSK
jgi:hypothetical protein